MQSFFPCLDPECKWRLAKRHVKQAELPDGFKKGLNLNCRIMKNFPIRNVGQGTWGKGLVVGN